MSKLKHKWSQWPANRRKWIKRTIGIVAGASAGYAYYALVGCTTGGCPITANPWVSTGWGALLGLTATA